jgi:hypothetical protein
MSRRWADACARTATPAAAAIYARFAAAIGG